MAESIVVIRLTRNLRYKLTYIKIFETYIEQNSDPEVVNLLRSLMQAQQAEIAPLASYLRNLDVNPQEVPLDDKLMTHALARQDYKSQLRFIYDGLSRAVAWYKMQLVDRQMIADPELRRLLFELGEANAAQLWRTEATMAMLKVPTTLKEKVWDERPRIEPEAEEGWRPRLLEDVGRPPWASKQGARWPRPPRYQWDQEDTTPKRKE